MLEHGRRRPSHIDPSQLANSLLNMAINARDAMPNGGKLLLETRNVVLDEAYAQANPDVAPGPYVMLAVSDTGTGMSPRGAGQGVRAVLHHQGGRQGHRASASAWSTASSSSPAATSRSTARKATAPRSSSICRLPAAQVEAAAGGRAACRGGTETILVVEDDALVRNFVIAQLQSLGYKTIAAADSPAALALVENGQTFDLLFTDVIMPGGMNGRQLADEVAKRRPGIKVLYTSGYTENAIVHHGRLDAGVLLLTKPYRKSQLAKMVGRR